MTRPRQAAAHNTVADNKYKDIKQFQMRNNIHKASAARSACFQVIQVSNETSTWSFKILL